MGNSLRGYLGNLCGTEESKRVNAENCDDRQPKEQVVKSEESTDGAGAPEGKTGEKELGCKEEVKETAGIDPEDIPEVLEEDEAERTQESLSLTPTAKRTLLYTTLNFTTPRFETFGIGELDQKFEGAHTILNNFVESLQLFKVNIQDFSKLYKKKDFEVALSLHQEISAKEEEGKALESESKAKVVTAEDISKGNALLLKARDQYPTVSKKISDTKEKLKGLVKDVESVSIKDYVRDEMGDKGFLSKVSVPGKYRRNAKVIRKKMKLLDECAVEVDNWYSRTASVESLDAQEAKPDLLGDVKLLEESPGVARQRKISQKQETDEEDTTDVTCTVIVPIALTDVSVSEAEIPQQQSLDDVDVNTPAIQEAAVQNDSQKDDRSGTDEATGESNIKPVIVEENCIAETRLEEEATPSILVMEDASSERIDEGTPAALEQPLEEAKEKSTTADAERETSPVPVEGKKETPKDKKKEGNTTETPLPDSTKSQKPKEVKDSLAKEKEAPAQTSSTKNTPTKSSDARKTPLEQLGTKGAPASSKPSAEATKASTEAKTTPIEPKKAASDTKTTPSQAKKTPVEVRVVEKPASTPEKTVKAEENDKIGVLPVMPGSSKLERKVSSASGDFEEGKLTDYGSYLVLTDDQELMKRSRSLDSLTSKGSRQSISRLGSFEIVTNFELMMAEQAETEKRKHLTDSQKSL